MSNYRVGNPSELVNILIEKEVQEIIIDVLGCFARTIKEWEEGALLIERHEKELVITNSEGEEMRFPIDYIMCAYVETSENDYFEITLDPTYIVNMLKAEVIEDLEQYEGYKKTQEVKHRLAMMRKEMGE